MDIGWLFSALGWILFGGLVIAAFVVAGNRLWKYTDRDARRIMRYFTAKGSLHAHFDQSVVATSSDDHERGPLGERVARIKELAEEISMLNLEIKADLASRVEAAEAYQAEAERARDYVELNSVEVDAIQRVIGGEMSTQLSTHSRGDRRFQIALAVGGFLAGVASSVIVTLIFSAVVGSS